MSNNDNALLIVLFREHQAHFSPSVVSSLLIFTATMVVVRLLVLKAMTELLRRGWLWVS